MSETLIIETAITVIGALLGAVWAMLVRKDDQQEAKIRSLEAKIEELENHVVDVRITVAKFK